MEKFANFVCKNKNKIIITSIILLIFSFIGMKLTKTNYDILVYLPNEIETVQGQEILEKDFNMGAYSIAIVDNLNSKEILNIEEEIRNIDNVNQVVSLYDLIGTNIPTNILPSDIVNKVNKDNTNLLLITFKEGTSSENTLKAVEEIRNLNKSVKQGGMSSMVLDTMNLSNKEIVIYVLIAVILCIFVLELTSNSYIIPFLLLANIGCAIVYNLGTNIFLGQISYITASLVAVLQLGVTTDFSIFLYHSYEKKKEDYKNNNDAMKEAIKETFTSVTGSSLTTIVGFLALCKMKLTLGMDLGLVMSKGVLLGVITVLTLFPSLILTFDNLIEKTKHKSINLNFTKLNSFIVKHYIPIFVIFILLFIPIYKANNKVEVYYKLDSSLPETLESISTNEILKDKFNIVSPEIIIIDKDIKLSSLNNMKEEIKNIKGIDLVLSFNEIKNLGITENMLNEDISSIFENDKYQLLLVNSIYDTATDELNNQVTILNDIVKKYDKNAIVAGVGPLTKDLVEISNEDFINVNTYSIMCIFIVLFFVLKSISLPPLLITVIESAIFTNMSIAYLKGSILPFVAPITLGTIQLGATIDYAILLTTTYLDKRKNNIPKKTAMLETLNYCGKSILTSGICFFASTFGVGIYSKIEMIASLCSLISKGALISMLTVITILPSTLLIFDKLILKTTINKEDKMKNIKKTSKSLLVYTLIFGTILTSFPTTTYALSKDETVYSKLDEKGNIKNITVNEKITTNNNTKNIEDYTELENILNISDNSTYKQNGKLLTWDNINTNLLYQGTINKTLPVSTNITYKLNGTEKTLNEILGKDGNIEITIKYTNNDKHGNLYTPFIVTTGTLLDNTSSNITVTNGKVVNNGKNNIIVSLTSPGLYESLNLKELQNFDTTTISYYTTNFYLPTIYSVMTPKVIEENDLEIFNKLDSLYNSVDSLKDNIDKINEGANTLNENSNLLKNTLKNNIDLLSQNDSPLTDEELNYIKTTTIQKIDSMYTIDKINEIKDNAWNMTKEQLETNKDTYIETLVKESISKEIEAYLKKEEINEYEDYVNCEKGKLIYTKTGVIPEDSIKSCEVIKNDKTLPYLKEALISQGKELSTNITYYIAKEVSTSVAEKTSIETAKTVASLISTSIANEVAKSAQDKSINSLNTLYNNIDLLSTGINTLSTSITSYNEQGITKLYNITNYDILPLQRKLENLVTLSNNYKSFAGINNNYEGNTKFISVIDKVKLTNNITKTNNTNNKLTLIDRIKNIFK